MRIIIRTILFIFCLEVILSSTTNENIISDAPKIILDKEATLIIDVVDFKSKFKITGRIHPYLDYADRQDIDFDIDGPGRYDQQIRVSFPNSHRIRIDRLDIDFYMLPSDTILIVINQVREDSISISFDGKLGEVNTFLLKKNEYPCLEELQYLLI